MASRRIPRTTAVDRAACQAAVAACVEAGCAVWINLVDGAVEVHAADWTGIDETAVAQAVAARASVLMLQGNDVIPLDIIG